MLYQNQMTGWRSNALPESLGGGTGVLGIDCRGYDCGGWRRWRPGRTDGHSYRLAGVGTFPIAGGWPPPASTRTPGADPRSTHFRHNGNHGILQLVGLRG